MMGEAIMWWRLAGLAMMATTVAGCAPFINDTTMDIDCAPLQQYMHAVPFTLLPSGGGGAVEPGASIAAATADNSDAAAAAAPGQSTPVESANRPTAPVAMADAATAAIINQLARQYEPEVRAALQRKTTEWEGTKEQPRVLVERPALLLSGGGQWGAFGAGFLNQLATLPPHRALPRPRYLSGISTGALQSLFVAANDLPGLERLYTQTPVDQIVIERNAFSSLINGARGSLEPLRTILLTSLCQRAGHCPMLEAIARFASEEGSGPDGMSGEGGTYQIGMVAAASGDFVIVDVGRMARELLAQHDTRTAQQCVAAVALASSSIPVNLQRVRIRYRAQDGSERKDVFYDGGARQSVFFGYSAYVVQSTQQQFQPIVSQYRPQAGAGTERALPDPSANAASGAFIRLLVVRNGPTTILPDDNINRKADVLSAATRGYSIIVNQSEDMSICSLRLLDPEGEIFFRSADGWPAFPGERPPRQMFNQVFMNRLAALGHTYAASTTPWYRLARQSALQSGEFCRVDAGGQRADGINIIH